MVISLESVNTIRTKMAGVPSTPAPTMAWSVQPDTPWKGFHPGNAHFEAPQIVKLEDAFEAVADPVVQPVNELLEVPSTPIHQGIPKRNSPPPAPKKDPKEYHGGFHNAPAAIQLFPHD